MGVLIKDFMRFAQSLTQRVKDLAYEGARAQGRPIEYLNKGEVSKEDLAREIARKDAQRLAGLYPQFVHHAIRSFSSPDVLRFLGKSTPNRFTGELSSTLKHRPEGVRVRHTINGNSLKTYDKQKCPSRRNNDRPPGAL